MNEVDYGEHFSTTKRQWYRTPAKSKSMKIEDGIQQSGCLNENRGSTLEVLCMLEQRLGLWSLCFCQLVPAGYGREGSNPILV
jgi:hypothetical protein